MEEETGIGRGDLEPLAAAGVVIIDRRRKRRWRNRFFVFRSATAKVRLNIENRAYRWVGLGDIGRYEDLLGSIEDRKAVLRLMGKHAKP